MADADLTNSFVIQQINNFARTVEPIGDYADANPEHKPAQSIQESESEAGPDLRTSVISSQNSTRQQYVAEVIPRKGRFPSRALIDNGSSQAVEVESQNPMTKDNNFSNKFKRKMHARAKTHFYELFQPQVLSTSQEPSRIRSSLDSASYNQIDDKV